MEMRLALSLALVACGSCGTPSNPSRRTLVVAYGTDEYPVTLNKERLGRYPLNADRGGDGGSSGPDDP